MEWNRKEINCIVMQQENMEIMMNHWEQSLLCSPTDAGPATPLLTLWVEHPVADGAPQRFECAVERVWRVRDDVPHRGQPLTPTISTESGGHPRTGLSFLVGYRQY